MGRRRRTLNVHRKPKIRPRTDRRFFAFFIPVSIALITVIMLNVTWKNAKPPPAPASDVDAVNGEVRVSLSEIRGGEAKFFQYRCGDGTLVRFITAEILPDTYRAALDITDKDRGNFHQHGQEFVCTRCKLRMPLTKLGDVLDGCYPLPLPYRIEAEHLIVQQSDLEQARRYFEPKP